MRQPVERSEAAQQPASGRRGQQWVQRFCQLAGEGAALSLSSQPHSGDAFTPVLWFGLLLI